MAAEKKLMATGTVAYSGSTFYITDISVDRKVDSTETTDTGTAGNGKEFTYGRQETGFSFTMWAQTSGSVLPIGANNACTITGDGVRTYVGSASLESENFSGNYKGAYTYKVAGKFNGAVTIS